MAAAKSDRSAGSAGAIEARFNCVAARVVTATAAAAATVTGLLRLLVLLDGYVGGDDVERRLAQACSAARQRGPPRRRLRRRATAAETHSLRRQQVQEGGVQLIGVKDGGLRVAQHEGGVEHRRRGGGQLRAVRATNRRRTQVDAVRGSGGGGIGRGKGRGTGRGRRWQRVGSG